MMEGQKKWSQSTQSCSSVKHGAAAGQLRVELARRHLLIISMLMEATG